MGNLTYRLMYLKARSQLVGPYEMLWGSALLLEEVHH